MGTDKGLAKNAACKAIVTGCILLAGLVLLTWPMASDLEDFLVPWVNTGDISCGIWQPWNLLRQLRTFSNPFVAPEFFYPGGSDTTLYVWNLGVPLLRAPFYLLLHPYQANVVSTLFFGLLNGLGGYAMGRVVGGRWASGVAGALLGLGCPYAWVELTEGRGEQGLLVFVFLSLAGLVSILRGNGGRRLVLLTGLAMGCAGICYWFYGYFLALVVGLVVPAMVLRGRIDRPTLRGVLLACGAAVAVALLPATVVMMRLLEDHTIFEQALAGDTSTFLYRGSMSIASLIWPLLPTRGAESHGWTSQVLIMLLLLGLLSPRVRRKVGWVVWVGVAAFVLAFGPVLVQHGGSPMMLGDRVLPLPFALLDVLPGFERFWWPLRFQALAQVAVAAIAGALVGSVNRPWLRTLLVAGLCAATIAESRIIAGFNGHSHRPPASFHVPELVTTLGRTPGKYPIMQVPLHNLGYLMWLPYHRQPIDGGIADARHLMPPAVAKRFVDIPVLAALSAVSQGKKASMPGVEAALCDLGYRYLLFWTQSEDAGRTRRWIHQLMVRKPDHTERALITWRLRPCAVDAPLPETRAPK